MLFEIRLTIAKVLKIWTQYKSYAIRMQEYE